jgi:ComF family protein
MKNTLVSLTQRLVHLCSRILFSRDTFSEILANATSETFVLYAKIYTGINPPLLPHGHILYAYRDPFVRNAIHAAKYRNRTDICVLFGELLWHTFGEELSNQSLMQGCPWIVIPIPLSKRHRRVRGYNQTEFIAEGFLKKADSSAFIVSTETLSMTSAHTHQTHTLRKSERLKNISGSFVVSDSTCVRGRTIILIDDVITTGATLHEASRVLYSAGARHVQCLAVAH